MAVELVEQNGAEDFHVNAVLSNQEAQGASIPNSFVLLMTAEYSDT